MGSIRLIVTTVAISLSLAVCATAAPAQSAGCGSTASATAPDDHAFAGYSRVTTGITPPKASHSPDPPYPDVPADTEPHGVVVMLIGVDAHGHVGPVQVMRSSAPVFEKSAVDTVKGWKFKPAKKDGKAVPVQITVEMSFAR
jgi:protein TonB